MINCELLQGPQPLRFWPAQGSIPYVPFLRAPYYVWVGHVPQLATILQENKVEAPPMFPPTFLYTQSWEDPRPDAKVRPTTLPLTFLLKQPGVLSYTQHVGARALWQGAHCLCGASS